MKALVLYSTRNGNTKVLAEAIAEVLRRCGEVDVRDAMRPEVTVPAADLVVIGGPTVRHSLTTPIARLLEHLGASDRTLFAAFDTRVRRPRLLSGSAAHDIAARLIASGATLVLPPQSFFVKAHAHAYVLEVGELRRARAWAAELAEAIDASVPVEVAAN